MVVTLIVMEPGSEWPGHVGDSENVVAIGHDEQTLSQRTKERLDAIRARGQMVREAMLACSDRTDEETVAERAAVAHELLGAVTGSPGRLVLTTRAGASARERRGLLSLAGTLTQKIRETRTSVSVRFGEQGRREIGLADGLGSEVLTHMLLRDPGPALPR